MTITTTTVTHDIDGNDIATSWSVPISIADKTTVSVKHEQSPGVFFDLVQDTDFTVSTITASAFTLELTSFILATGEKLHVLVSETLTQEDNLDYGGVFPSSVLEAMADKLTRLIQKLNAAVDLCIRFSLGKGIDFNALLPDPIANKFLKFNSSGDGITTGDPVTVENGGIANADTVANTDTVVNAATVEQATNVEQAINVNNADTVTNADTVINRIKSVFVNNANGNPNVSDTILLAHEAVAEGTWTSIGPTGSGADLEWDALTQVLPGSDYIEIYFRGTCNSVSLANVSISGYARKYGSSEGDIVFYAVDYNHSSGATGSFACYNNVIKVPIDANRMFDFRWVNGGDSKEIRMALTGYGKN